MRLRHVFDPRNWRYMESRGWEYYSGTVRKAVEIGVDALAHYKRERSYESGVPVRRVHPQDQTELQSPQKRHI